MTRNGFVFLVVSLIMLCSITDLLGYDAYYQDKTGPVPLWYDQTRLVVKFASGVMDDGGGGLASIDPAFDSSKPPEQINNEFYYVWLASGSNVASTLERLDTNVYVEIANPIYLSAVDSHEMVALDLVSVKFLDGVSKSVIDSLLNFWQVQIADSLLAELNFYALKATKNSGRSVLEIANIFEQDSRTEFAIPSFLANIVPDYYPYDPYFPHQYYLHNAGQTGGTPDVDIDALEAWEFGFGDTSLVIAVIDKGIEEHFFDYNGNDVGDLLANRIVPGYDFVGNNIRDSGYLPDADPSPGDLCHAHGMACAGIIAAAHSEYGLAHGLAGLAPNCKIMPLKTWDNSGQYGSPGPGPLPPNTPYYYFSLALAYARFTGGADIVSNSWTIDELSGGCDTAYFDFYELRFAVKYLSSTALVFFSAGNTDAIHCLRFPANMKEVISVGAVDKYNVNWTYGPQFSLGDSLDLVAPTGDAGQYGDVWTLDIMSLRGYNPIINCDQGQPDDIIDRDFTSHFGGTSAACAQGAGVGALLMSYDRKSPWRNMTLNDYKTVLKNSADDEVVFSPGWDPVYGYGRLNAMKALVAIARGDINKSGTLTLGDIIGIVNYINYGTPITPHKGLADTNCDGLINYGDAINLSNYLFQNPPGWPPPPICFQFNYP